MSEFPAEVSPNPPLEENTNAELNALVEAAQRGDEGATEKLLEKFRPLIRRRSHQIWTGLQDQLSATEWEDVEAQVQFSFLTRLQRFQPQQGVYFAHYIQQMLEHDGRDWLRRQRRSAALPFSQIESAFDNDDDFSADNFEDRTDWMQNEVDDSIAVEWSITLREALSTLTKAQQEVVWACCVQGQSEHEAAAWLGLSRSAVRNRLSGAVAKLRSYYENEEDEVSMAILQRATRTGRARSSDAIQAMELEQNVMSKNERRPDLVGVGAGRPVLLQGLYEFQATGFKTPELLSPKLRYLVPAGCVAGIRFFRVGVSCEKMVYFTTMVNGMPHRYIPVAANSTIHVPFAIVEPIPAGSEIEIHVASDAPGIAIVDVGCLQMPA